MSDVPAAHLARAGALATVIAPVFAGGRLVAACRAPFVGNFVASVAGAIATIAAPGWVLEPAGLVALAAWNLLVLVMAILAIVALRPLDRRDAR